MSDQLINAIAEMDEEDALALTKELLAAGTHAGRDPGRLPGGDGAGRQAVRARGVLHPRADPGRRDAQGVSAEVKPYMTGAQAERQEGRQGRGRHGEGRHPRHRQGHRGVHAGRQRLRGDDLGIDVPVQTFVDKIAEVQAGGGGAERLPDAGLRLDEGDGGGDRGGRAARRRQDHGRRRQVDEQVRKYAGADAFGLDAMAAVSLAKGWMRRRKST